jgi:PAS domain S-box-containing protein
MLTVLHFKLEWSLSHTIKIKKPTNEIFYFIYFFIPLEDNSFGLLFINNTNANNEIMMLNNIINTAPDPIFVKNDQHQFMYVNQAFSESLGMPATHILGKSDTDFFPKTESDIFYKVDRKTFKTEKTTINEETFTSKMGVRTISTKKSVFRTLAGHKILVGVIRDVTELNNARECLKKHARELKRQVVKEFK